MKHYIGFLLVLPLSGCLQQAAKPSDITLVAAMEQVGAGLAKMREAQGDLKTGLVAESAEVTFKITADSKRSGSLKVDLSAPAVSEGVGVGGTLGAENTAGRSNTVTIKFKNILTLPKETVGYVVAENQVAAGKAAGKPIEVLPPELDTFIIKGKLDNLLIPLDSLKVEPGQQ
ncbi:hypothetical protein [Metapseudomonas otitidis]|uniref:hypothetical protein n=1 Tax=Metapseudomonas otitidis TaxID=319939 RepID=UPI0013F5E533|nr:hypothetical protein [Pseudomonas otitidis]